MLRTSARYQSVASEPGERQVLADVVGVAVVEVGGERALDPLARPRRPPARSPATERPRLGAAAAGAADRRQRRRGGRVSEPLAARPRRARRRRCASPARRCVAGRPWRDHSPRPRSQPHRAAEGLGGLGDAPQRAADAPPGGSGAGARRGDVARSGALVCSASSTWGTCPQSSRTTCWASGSASADVAGETRRHQAVASRPRRTAPAARARRGRVQKPLLAVRLVEVDVARRGEERDPGGARAVGAAELVDGDVGGRRVEALRDARTGSRTARGRSPRAAGGGWRRAPGAAGAPAAPARGAGGRRAQGASRLRLATRSGALKRDLERDPAAHRVADQVGAVDRHRVHVAAARPRRTRARRRRRGRASPRSRIRAGRSRGRCGRGSARRPSRRTTPCWSRGRAGRSPARARGRRSGSRSARPESRRR